MIIIMIIIVFIIGITVKIRMTIKTMMMRIMMINAIDGISHYNTVYVFHDVDNKE